MRPNTIKISKDCCISLFKYSQVKIFRKNLSRFFLHKTDFQIVASLPFDILVFPNFMIIELCVSYLSIASTGRPDPKNPQ